jgi:hypothetical protein
VSAAETPRAFPSAAIDDAYGGMSLRQFYAGQALPSTMEQAMRERITDPRMIAKAAFVIADAMIEEGAK